MNDLVYAQKTMTKRNTQSGFGIIGIAAIIVTLGVAGTISLLAYNNFIKKLLL